MKRFITIFITTILILVLSCSEKTNDNFVLNGLVDNIPDNSQIYLLLENEIIDSSKVFNNKFLIKGNINNPKKYSVLIKETNDYSSFWIAKGENYFKSKKGDFRNAIIKGSKVHLEQDEYSKHKKFLIKERRKLLKQEFDEGLDDEIRKKAAKERGILISKSRKYDIDFINKNTKSFISIYLLDFYASTYGGEKTKMLFDNFSDDLKQSYYGKSIERYLELSQDLKIGDKYIDFSMNDVNNKTIRISDFDGKLILIDFWASWCGPCKEEFPTLRKIYLLYKNKGFEIVGVSQDQSKENWIKSITSNNLNWINLWDKKADKSDPHIIYNINGIPDNFLIDEKGFVIGRNLRGNELIKVIEEYFDKTASL